MSVRNFLIVLVICFQDVVFGQTEGFAVSDGLKIYYRSFGEGTPILIINGGPGMNSNGFEPLAKLLAKKHRTIIYDQRGTGKSTIKTLNASTLTMDLMIEDIEQIRKHLHIDRWIVLGHSFGGMVASYYATVYPKQITSLILSSSGGIDLGLLSYARKSIDDRLSKMELDSVRYWERKIERGDTSYYARLRRGVSLAPAYLYNKNNVPVLADRLTQGNSTVNTLMWENLSSIGFDCRPGLQTFHQPVLIIQGKQDIIKKETALNAQKALKNSTVIILDSCGHYGWLDQEKTYLNSIENFISSL